MVIHGKPDLLVKVKCLGHAMIIGLSDIILESVPSMVNFSSIINYLTDYGSVVPK